jgi:hypothetical protein
MLNPSVYSHGSCLHSPILVSTRTVHIAFRILPYPKDGGIKFSLPKLVTTPKTTIDITLAGQNGRNVIVVHDVIMHNISVQNLGCCFSVTLILKF